MAETFKRTVLATGEYAERVEFWPRGGEPRRTLTALVERSTRARDGREIGTEDELVVTVFRTVDDVDVGGIDVPRPGDLLRRLSDPRDQRYTWAREVLDETSFSLRLRYIRAAIHQHGTTNTRAR